MTWKEAFKQTTFFKIINAVKNYFK